MKIKYEFKFISGYKMVDGKQVPITEEENAELMEEARKNQWTPKDSPEE